jgi:hypothetical protein
MCIRDSFLTGVQDLTMEERGQYITLLCLQHQKGHLTQKIVDLSCRGIVSADVMAKFRQDPAGLWYNQRLELEANKRAEHSEKQRKRALDGWQKRKSEAAESATANATALPLENEIVNENINDNEIPSFDVFKNYAISKKSNVNIEALNMKYQSWIESGWKCGKPERKIKNWKSTLLNTLPYINENTNTPNPFARYGF